MGIYDFVGGILVGIVFACLNFVVQTSRKSAIRASYPGSLVESTVRRHPTQRHFLHEAGQQIVVTKLAGMLFFGSIVQVEKKSRALIEEEAFRRHPIRYLIFDLAHVTGIDYSAAEAFTRMERILARRSVRMLISGADKEDDLGKSLRSVGLWNDDSGVEFFETLNSALEYCENELLAAFYQRKDAMIDSDRPLQTSLDIPKPEHLRSTTPPNAFTPSLSSPRQRFLHQAATATLDDPEVLPPKKWATFRQPLSLLLQVFQNLTNKNEDFWFRAVDFFVRKDYPVGSVLFERGVSYQAHQYYFLGLKALTEYCLYFPTLGQSPGLLPASDRNAQGKLFLACGEIPGVDCCRHDMWGAAFLQ